MNMTIAENRFLESVPIRLAEIAKALVAIQKELEKLNEGKK